MNMNSGSYQQRYSGQQEDPRLGFSQYTMPSNNNSNSPLYHLEGFSYQNFNKGAEFALPNPSILEIEKNKVLSKGDNQSRSLIKIIAISRAKPSLLNHI